ncbi:MAG TPA: hemolysin III family protein [Trebonia sp.]
MTYAGPTGAGLLYDARRGVYYAKPALRGWLHALCFVASLAGGAALLARAHGGAQITGAAVYSASLGALFGTSTLYHRGTWTAVWRLRLRHLDQAMIFFLIAGTATPAFLLSAPADLGLACLIAMWVLTLTAVTVRLARASTPELVAGALFIALGCVGGLALPWVWIHAGAASGVLLLAGGLLYIAGALSYHRRWPDPYPSLFGYHEVFHVYVCAAAACQYAAIALFIG